MPPTVGAEVPDLVRPLLDWTLALVARLIGLFVGGLLISLLSGDELQLQPSGIIGSLIGGLVVTAVWQWYRRRSRGTHA